MNLYTDVKNAVKVKLLKHNKFKQMRIETKFNVGDKCYYLSDNVAKKAKVIGIRIKVELDERGFTETIIVYKIEVNYGTIERRENYLFKSKKELAEHIVGQSAWEKIKNKLFK